MKHLNRSSRFLPNDYSLGPETACFLSLREVKPGQGGVRIRYRDRQGWIPNPARFGFALSALYLFAACVSVQVEPLTQQPYPARASTKSVELLQAEPPRPHVKLARIIATSRSASEETLRDRILGRAWKLGADAVILGQADVIKSMGPSPLYQSTLSSVGAITSQFSGG